MNLEVSSGTVYGCVYHTVKPEIWDWSEWHYIAEWANHTYGPTSEDGVWTPNMRWYFNNSKFWFRDESDLAMFILRWQ